MRPRWCNVSFMLGMSACLAAGVGGSARGLDAPPPAVRVMVSNDGATDVVVYAYRSGARMRIGFVLGHGHCVVTVPAGMTTLGHVQLLLHPVTGGADFLVDEVPIRADQEHVELHVTPMLDESSVTVVAGTLRS